MHLAVGEVDDATSADGPDAVGHRVGDGRGAGTPTVGGAAAHARPAAPHRARPRLPRRALAPSERDREPGHRRRPSTTAPSPSATGPSARSPSAPPTPTTAADAAARARRRAGDREARRRRRARRRPPTAHAWCRPQPVEVVCGLGAGDAFGGALVPRPAVGLDAGAHVGVRQRGRRDRGVAASCAPTRCPPPPRSPPDWSRAVSRITDAQFADLIDVRVREPDRIADGARGAPRRRPCSHRDGMLFIVAADHTARGMVGLGDDPLAMADRRVDARPPRWSPSPTRGSTACSASADILEDLVLLGALDGPGRRRHDEPRRPRRRPLGDRRPLHRLRRRAPRRRQPRRRQDAAAHRRRRRRHRPDARGVRRAPSASSTTAG